MGQFEFDPLPKTAANLMALLELCNVADTPQFLKDQINATIEKLLSQLSAALSQTPDEIAPMLKVSR